MSTWIGSAGNYSTTTAMCTVTMPAGWQPGDLAILVGSSDSGVDPVWNPPAGWTFRAKTASTNMYSYIWTKVLQAGDTSVGYTLPSGSLAVGVWRGATLGTIGTFGIKAGTWNYVSAPDIVTSGYRAHIYAERSIASTAGEADTLHTLTYGTARGFYGGNPTVAATAGIVAVYFSDSAPGQSGANTATFADSSTNGWGIQIDLGTGVAPAAPVASFTASPTTVTVGGQVQFTDTSTNTPTSWSWNFGSGGPASVTTRNPLVTFPTVGTYNVVLTATNAGGSDPSDPITITVKPVDTKINIRAVGDTGYNFSGSVLTLTTPASAAVGDYLIAFIAAQQHDSTDYTPPSGWTRVNTPYVSDIDVRTQSMFGFALNSAPAASYDFAAPIAGSNRQLGFIVSFRNVDLVNPIVSASPFAKGGTTTSISVPQFSADYYLLEMWSGQFASPNSYAISSYTGALTRVNEAYNPSGAENTGVSRSSLVLFGGQPGAAGNPAHVISTTGTAAASAASQIALRLSGEPPPPVVVGMAIKVSDGTTLKDSRLQVSNGSSLYTPRAIKKVSPGYPNVASMLQTKFYCAHRGGSRDWPEMSAFAYGQSAIYDYGALELSLARTSDGVWFGLHDQYLDRTSLGSSTTTLNPANMTWAQVQAYKIKGSVAVNNPTQPDRPYMRFEELMSVYYFSHVIFVDIKYAGSYITEFLDKLDAMPGNPRERFVGKSYGVSGPSNNASGFAKDFAARGYQTWGYFYETDSANFVAYAPRWSFLGMDYGASQSAWDALKAAAPGKLVMGHICPDQAAVNTATTKGAGGFMVSSPVKVKPSGVSEPPVVPDPPVSTGMAGAVALGQASYSVVGTPVHVYPGDSLQNALNTVQQDGTVVLHASVSGGVGVYRIPYYSKDGLEGFRIPNRCTIQNAPGDEVWLDGSRDISGATWTNNGNGTWSTTYTCKPRLDLSGTLWGSKDNPSGVLIPDQCWINGVRQWVLPDRQTPAAGQVSFDPSTSKVTIATNPSGNTVEVSDATAMLLQMTTATIRGIGIRRSSNTSVEWMGAAVYTADSPDNSVYENLHFVDHSVQGLSVGKVIGARVSYCTFTDCGMTGMGISGRNDPASTAMVENNKFARINFKKWNPEPTTACFKTTGSNRLVTRYNHLTDFYNCMGIWYDISCIHLQIYGNYINGAAVTLGKRASIGVHSELSDGGFAADGSTRDRSLIAGNTVLGCESNMSLLRSGYHDVVCNTFDGGNGPSGAGLYVRQDPRSNYDGNRSITETPWISQHNRSINNRTLDGRRQLFLSSTGATGVSANNNSGMDFFDRIEGNWCDSVTTGNDFANVQADDGSWRNNAKDWATLKSYTDIGDTNLVIGPNGQGTWGATAALTYAVPLEAAWAAVLGKTVGWKGVGNPLADPTPR